VHSSCDACNVDYTVYICVGEVAVTTRHRRHMDNLLTSELNTQKQLKVDCCTLLFCVAEISVAAGEQSLNVISRVLIFRESELSYGGNSSK
jgi:hypothetical protein